MRYQKRVSTCFPLSIYEFQFLSLRLKEEKGKQMNACQLQIRRDSIYKILKKKKKKESAIPTFLTKLRSRATTCLAVSSSSTARITLNRACHACGCWLSWFRRNVRAKKPVSADRCAAASYRACTSPLRSGVSAVKSGRIPRKAQNFQPPGSPN